MDIHTNEDLVGVIETMRREVTKCPNRRQLARDLGLPDPQRLAYFVRVPSSNPEPDFVALLMKHFGYKIVRPVEESKQAA